MNHIMKKTAVWTIGGLLTLPAYGVAAPVINETWSGYNDGDQPAAPWVLHDVTNGQNDPDSITVQSGQVLLDNVGTTTGNYNPVLARSFAATTENLNISFDYRIPKNYGTGSQILFQLRDSSSTPKTAVVIVLGRNYMHNGIAFRDSTGSFQGVGHTFSANETVHVSLTNINPTAHTFNVAWSSSTGGSGSANGSFRDLSVMNFAQISFGESSLESSVSKVYIDNIEVSTVPEPATTGVLAGTALLAAVGIRHRR